MKAVLLGTDRIDFNAVQRLFIAAGWELCRVDPEITGRASDERRDSALEVLLRDGRVRRDTILVVDAESNAKSASRIIRSVRHRRLQTPIVVLAPALGNPSVRADVATALRTGADDFFVRPIPPGELAVRLGALLERHRRSDSLSPDSVGDLEISPASRILKCNEQSVTLTAYEYVTFQRLARRIGQPVARELLLRRPHRGGRVARSNLVDVYVLYLRQKLAGIGSRCAIKTIRNVGYMLVAPEGGDAPSETGHDRPP